MSKSTKVISSKEDVEAFLHDLISVLNSPNFDIDTDLDILPKEENGINYRSIYNSKYDAGTRL